MNTQVLTDVRYKILSQPEGSTAAYGQSVIAPGQTLELAPLERDRTHVTAYLEAEEYFRFGIQTKIGGAKQGGYRVEAVRLYSDGNVELALGAGFGSSLRLPEGSDLSGIPDGVMTTLRELMEAQL